MVERLIRPEHSDPTNTEMDSFLDRYLPNRKPVSLGDYNWGAIRPDSVDHDIFDALTFVTLVEANPKDPADKILTAADKGNAPWLRRFIKQCWLPEELMHHAPYREYLIRSNKQPQEWIDNEIHKVRERGFAYGTGYTPLQATIYGWLQELITQRFYESMRSYLLGGTQTKKKEYDPVLVKILGDIAKQENFHRHVYFTGAKTVLKYHPDRKREVVAAASEFIMPGHHMSPEYQTQAPHWSVKFEFPVRSLLHDISRGLVELAGYNGLGQAVISYVTKNKIPWYLKVPASVASPLAGAYSSPINYVTGRFAARF